MRRRTRRRAPAGLPQPAGVRVADDDAGALLQERACGRAADPGAGRRGDRRRCGRRAGRGPARTSGLVVRHGATLTYQTLVREGWAPHHGPGSHARPGGLPGRGARLARGARARRAAALAGDRRRVSRRTGRGRRELAADRWSVVVVARGVRRPGRRPLQWLVFEEEYYAAGAPGPGHARTASTCWPPPSSTTAPPEQRARILPPMATGEVIWAQAWSEPEAGPTWPRCAPRPRAPAAAGC